MADDLTRTRALMNALLEGGKAESRAPEAKSFGEAEARELLGYLERWINASGNSQGQAARAIGLTDSAMNDLVSGRTRKGEHLLRIQQFLDREAERVQAPGLSRFVMTSFAERIFKCLRQNYIHGTIGLVLGRPGRGKTRAFQEFARRNAGVYRVSGASWIRTARQLAEAISGCILRDAPHRRLTFAEITEQLLEKVRGQACLVIIDQAHQLSTDMHEFIQNLYDTLNDSVGGGRFAVVLGATYRLRAQLLNPSSGYAFEQFTSRLDLGYTLELDGAFSLDDVRQVFAPDNVRYPLGPAVLELLRREANGSGGLRRAVAMVRHLQELYAKRDVPQTTPLDVRGLEQAKRLMLRRAA
jgi:predicted XRE-type DNA-binding protein